MMDPQEQEPHQENFQIVERLSSAYRKWVKPTEDRVASKAESMLAPLLDPIVLPVFDFLSRTNLILDRVAAKLAGFLNFIGVDKSKFRALEDKQFFESSSQTVRKTLLTLVVFASFCVITLGAPDELLLAERATINLPFTNSLISFNAFIFVRPLILIVLASYMHIFFEEVFHLRLRQDAQYAFIFHLSSPLAILVSTLALYWLVPAVILYFSWKNMPRSDGDIFLLFAAATCLSFGLLYSRRTLPFSRFKGLLALFFSVLLALIPASIAIWNLLTPEDFKVSRKLHLRKASFEGMDLSNTVFKGAELASSSFSEATLYNVNFEGANLANANFKGARLIGASFVDANLEEVNFSGAYLETVRFPGAKIKSSDFHGSEIQACDFRGLNMTNVKFKPSALEGCRLDGADMSGLILSDISLERTSPRGIRAEGTVFERTNLKQAILTGGNFRQANFSDADLTSSEMNRADFRNALFLGTNLSWGHVAESRFDGSYLVECDLSGLLGWNLLDSVEGLFIYDCNDIPKGFSEWVISRGASLDRFKSPMVLF